MKNSACTLLFIFLASLLTASSAIRVKIGGAMEKPQTYLVYVNYPPGVNKEAFENKILQQALGSVEAAERALIYQYELFPVFAARLSLNQVKELLKNPDIEAVERDRNDMKPLKGTKETT